MAVFQRVSYMVFRTFSHKSHKNCRRLLSVIGGCLCLSAAYAGGEEVARTPLSPCYQAQPIQASATQ